MSVRQNSNAKHLDRLAIELATRLHGLDMLDIEQVLDKTRTLVRISARFDATGTDFRHQVDGYAKHYGEAIDTPTRQ